MDLPINKYGGKIFQITHFEKLLYFWSGLWTWTTIRSRLVVVKK